MAREGLSAARAVATAAIASALLALLAAAGGCELAIGSAVPDFECVPGNDTCPRGQTCDPSVHRCVPACNVAGCSAGMQCDTASGLCVAVDGGVVADAKVEDSPADTGNVVDSSPVEEDTGVAVDGSDAADSGPCNTVGCPCTGAKDCMSGICADQSTVTQGLYTAAGGSNFCTQPCCTSSDCPADTVCFATGQGGDYCVNPTWIGRGAGSGSGAGGALCTSNEGCRSGLCSNGRCADTCCSSAAESAECSGQACVFGNFPNAMSSIDKNYSAHCGQASGTGTSWSNCSWNSDCESNLCGSSQCNGACRGAGDCASGGYCNYVLGQGTPTPVMAACFTPQGSATQGQTCTTTNDPCKGFCDPLTKQCTDVCFADQDCTVTGWHCRPELLPVSGGGSYSLLRCGP